MSGLLALSYEKKTYARKNCPTGPRILELENALNAMSSASSPNSFGRHSMPLLIETTGGFDYTGADCQSCMHETGPVKRALSI
jgi:hypothetical protein